MTPEKHLLPLQGIVVIELGSSVAAPFAGQILGDLGAQVVKIEKTKGDDARHWGPPFVDGSSATFQSMNRNKRSVVLDLRSQLDLSDLKQWIQEHADVVLQNMRPGQVESMGLDADSLRKQKPSLVYCNLGAFGQSGPLSQRPGYDPLMQAFGGIMSVVGSADGPSVRVGPSMVDMGTGMWAALGIVSLLMRRQQLGEGGVVDVSLFETSAGWMSMFAAQYQASGELPRKNGSGQVGIVPYRAFATQDGELMVAAGNNVLFAGLCKALEHPEWAQDRRFETNPLRVENMAALHALIEPIMVLRNSAHWTEELDRVGVPCAPLQNVAQMIAHPQTQAMGLMQAVPGSSIPLMGLPIRIDGVRPQPRSAPPSQGEAGALSQLRPSKL